MTLWKKMTCTNAAWQGSIFCKISHPAHRRLVQPLVFCHSWSFQLYPRDEAVTNAATPALERSSGSKPSLAHTERYNVHSVYRHTHTHPRTHTTTQHDCMPPETVTSLANASAVTVVVKHTTNWWSRSRGSVGKKSSAVLLCRASLLQTVALLSTSHHLTLEQANSLKCFEPVLNLNDRSVHVMAVLLQTRSCLICVSLHHKRSCDCITILHILYAISDS